MLIAGPCLFADVLMRDEILKTAERLEGKIDLFRCKLWGGGTTPEKYMPGVGAAGVELLSEIDRKYMPVMVEVQTVAQAKRLLWDGICNLWIGARNSANYGFIDELAILEKEYKLYVKRGMGMTVDETVGIFDIWKARTGKEIYLIDRGVVTIDRRPDSRWMPDIRTAIIIKQTRPDIFERLIIDCSHSTGKKEWAKDCYDAFKAIGVKNFMFEVMSDPELSRTDKPQILSIPEYLNIIKGA